MQHASAVNAARTRFANQQLDFNQQRTVAKQDFGFGQFADAATNPYSRAALLRHSFNVAQRGTKNTANRQLYAGSYENEQRHNERQYDKASDRLGREYRAALAGIDREELAAREGMTQDVESAGWRRLENAAREKPDPAPVPAGRRRRRRRRQRVRRRRGRRRRRIRTGLSGGVAAR